MVFLSSLAPRLPLPHFSARYVQTLLSNLKSISRSESESLSSLSISSAILARDSGVKGENTTISSTRAINSGRKKPSSALSAFSFDASACVFPKPSRFSLRSLPAFEVITIMVFSKFTVLPCASVILPSSRICSSTFSTSGWAFSISSNSTTEYGFLRTFSVSCPASSYPTYPGGAPIMRETECFSINSDISRRISVSGVSKSCSDSTFTSSVLPTPVGPTKIKEAGRCRLFV